MEEELEASTMNDQMIIEPGLVGFREENVSGGDYHDILSEIKEEGLYASDGDSYFLAAEMIERMMKVPPQPEQSNQEQSERIGDSEEEIGDNGSLNITYYSILDEDDEMNPSGENGFEEEEEKMRRKESEEAIGQISLQVGPSNGFLNTISCQGLLIVCLKKTKALLII